MSQKFLKNKPLVEALVEVRWALGSPAPNVNVDPYYKLLLGRLFDRVKTAYPEHEQLPSALMPDEFAGYIVQHRFRRTVNGWPLVQVGPGIFAVNETVAYVWDDFRDRAISAVKALYEAHPKPEDLKITSLLLRYIDARPFDYGQEDVLAFLRKKMGVEVLLPSSLFEDNNIKHVPKNFTTQAAFDCGNPPGTVSLGIATGISNDQQALVWETMVQSGDSEIPTMPDDFDAWLNAAHAITHDWFFKLIEGDLEKEFGA